MNTTRRTVLLALVFALIASMVLEVGADARRGHRHHSGHGPRTSVARDAGKDRGSPVIAAAKRKRKGRGGRSSGAPAARNTPVLAIDPALLSQPVGPISRGTDLRDLDDLNQTIDPSILNPDPCDEVEPVLNGFLPQTVTLTKSDSFLAKLTVGQGVQVLTCDLANHDFEVRFDNATIKTYVKASAGGISVGGWNQTASLSGSIRVSFTVNFSPPSTIVLTNLTVLGVNFANSPNWLDNSLIKDALNAMFPDSIAVS